MVSLKHIENAKDKEDPNGLYQWAKLFVATNWEDVKTIVEQNDYMKSIASGIRTLSEDEKVRQACEARDKVLHDMASRYYSGKEDGRAEGAAEKEQELIPIIQQKEAIISEQGAVITKTVAALSERDAEVAQLKALLAKNHIPLDS